MTDPMIEKLTQVACNAMEDVRWGDDYVSMGTAEAAVIAVLRTLREPDEKTLGGADFHSGRHSVSGETYPVQRNFIRAYIDSILTEEKETER